MMAGLAAALVGRLWRLRRGGRVHADPGGAGRHAGMMARAGRFSRSDGWHWTALKGGSGR
jgi:hypothetical protein